MLFWATLAAVLVVWSAGCADSLVDPEAVKVKAAETNRAPVAMPDSVTVLQNVPIVINILRNDRDVDGRLDPSSVLITEPLHGAAESHGDSTVTYLVGYEFLGVDRFTYTVADDFGVRSEPAVVKVTVVLAPPPAPEVSVPADGAVHLGPRVTFAWKEAPRADGYRLEVSTTEDFASPVFVSTQSGRSAVAPLEREKSYFWRVRAVNAAGAGPWSPVRTFSTIPYAPGVVVLLEPVDNAVAVSLEPGLRWLQQPTTLEYQIQLATNVAFAGAAFEATVGTSEVVVPPGRLEIGKRYFWRVRGSNAGGLGPWSPSWSFVAGVGLPSAPVLRSPEHGAANLPVSPQLSWDPVEQAETYRLQVSRDAAFAAIVFDETGSSVERVIPAGRLAFQTVYWWRVRGANVAGAGSWSEVRTFSTVPPPPAVPSLFSPPDGATGISVAPTLIWSPAFGAASYQVQVAGSITFEVVVYEVDTADLFVSLPSKWLDPGEIYSWRVRSVNAGGPSAWSTVHSFQTAVEGRVDR